MRKSSNAGNCQTNRATGWRWSIHFPFRFKKWTALGSANLWMAWAMEMCGVSAQAAGPHLAFHFTMSFYRSPRLPNLLLVLSFLCFQVSPDSYSFRGPTWFWTWFWGSNRSASTGRLLRSILKPKRCSNEEWLLTLWNTNDIRLMMMMMVVVAVVIMMTMMMIMMMIMVVMMTTTILDYPNHLDLYWNRPIAWYIYICHICECGIVFLGGQSHTSIKWNWNVDWWHPRWPSQSVRSNGLISLIPWSQMHPWIIDDWLVVSTILKNISQMGWFFPIYGKIKNVPNHQPGVNCTSWVFRQVHFFVQKSHWKHEKNINGMEHT